MENLFTILFIGLWLGGIYGLVSIGLTLIFGVIRITNFAHGEVLMVGMYGTYLAYSWLGLNPYLAVVVVVGPPLVSSRAHRARRRPSRPAPSPPRPVSPPRGAVVRRVARRPLPATAPRRSAPAAAEPRAPERCVGVTSGCPDGHSLTARER